LPSEHAEGADGENEGEDGEGKTSRLKAKPGFFSISKLLEINGPKG
jgi:hypothetical protein